LASNVDQIDDEIIEPSGGGASPDLNNLTKNESV